MKFTSCSIQGVQLIELREISDQRGTFVRQFCQAELEAHGLNGNFIQGNSSTSLAKGTLRGMHYQSEPYAEAKLVSCTKGSVADIIVDVRKESDTYLQSLTFELTEQDHLSIYIPAGVAHGYMTLEDNTHINYLTTKQYMPEYERGICWNDPKVEVELPFSPKIVSEKDTNWPNFNENLN